MKNTEIIGYGKKWMGRIFYEVYSSSCCLLAHKWIYKCGKCVQNIYVYRMRIKNAYDLNVWYQRTQSRNDHYLNNVPTF